MNRLNLAALAVASSLCSFAAGASAASPLMKPGLWEINTQNQMEGAAMPAMPNIPPEQMAKLKEMGINMPAMGPAGKGGMSFTLRHCVTKEEAERGVPPSKDDGKCKPTSVKREGNTVSWAVECTGEHPATGSGSVVYESPESFKGNMAVNTKGAQAMSMKTSYSGKWLSATCEK